MTRSFRDKRTARLWNRERVPAIDPTIQHTALRKLRQLGAATTLDDLRVPPGNRLEALRGNVEGNTASGSTISGASASHGEREEPKMSRSSTTTEVGRLEPVHPGEVLMEDLIRGLGLTQTKVAVAIGVSPRRINEIVHGKRSLTADTALRLSRYFGTSAQFWLNLQDFYDLDVYSDSIQSQLDAIEPLRTA